MKHNGLLTVNMFFGNMMIENWLIDILNTFLLWQQSIKLAVYKLWEYRIAVPVLSQQTD